VKINEKISIEPDAFGWIVKVKAKHIAEMGKDKGKMVEPYGLWYPGTLEHAGEMVIDMAAKKDAGEAKVILDAIRKVKEECVAAIKKIPYKHTEH